MDLYLKKLKLPSYLFLKGVLLLLLFFISNSRTQAQNSAPIDTVTHAFLPALGYNSDLGLLGGGLFNRYHYKNNTGPFYSYLSADALISTKGLLTAKVLFDKPHVRNTLMRLTSFAYVSRFLQNQFYGIGDYTNMKEEVKANPDLYLFKSFSTGFEFTLRRPMKRFQNESQIDLVAMLTFDYETPFGNDTDRLIQQQKPLGFNGARTSAIGAGLVWEGRDNEFAPTKGYFFTSTLESGQNIFGSSYNYLSIKSEVRAYHSFFLIRKITFANRLSFRHNSGEIPYWKLADLGGEETMRGYPENRFLDENALILNTELRSWLFDFPESDFRLGGTIFMDIGRTYANGTAFNDIYDDLKYTYGFGGITSLFTDEFILRIDLGFSDEGYGVYFTSGFMF